MPGNVDMAQILGVRLDNVTMDDALERIRDFVKEGKPRSIFTPNVDFLMLARRDPEFLHILNGADINLCDSVPLLWSSRMLGAPLKARVAGSDLFPAACELAAKEGYRVYLMGGGPSVAAKAAEVLSAAYSGLQVAGTWTPPMGFHGSPQESYKILGAIRSARPHLLFVALGTPKQERWIHRFKDELGVPVSIGVGASFDFVAGAKRRAPQWTQSIGLEWLFRLCQEPRRLWRRYLLRDSQFVPVILNELFRRRIRQWSEAE